MRPRRRTGRARGAEPPLERLRSLAQIAGRVIELQPDAEDVIVACSYPGDTPAAVARRGGQIARELYQLHGRATELAGDFDPDSLLTRVAQLVHYHAELVDMCLKLAFPKCRTARLESRRLALGGLGESARTLRDARAALDMWINELEWAGGFDSRPPAG